MPEPKQFGDLSPADFDRHPVWVSCHGTDDGRPWYDETDEETFRPWTGAPPVGQADGMFLVRATCELRNGSRYSGFITPAFHETALECCSPTFSLANAASDSGEGCLAYVLRSDRPSTRRLRTSLTPSFRCASMQIPDSRQEPWPARSKGSIAARAKSKSSIRKVCG